MKNLGYEIKIDNFNGWMNKLSNHKDLQKHYHLLQNLAK